MASRLLEDHCIRTHFVVPMNPFHNRLRVATCRTADLSGTFSTTDFVQCHPPLSGAGMLCTQCILSDKLCILVPTSEVNFQHPVLGIAK